MPSLSKQDEKQLNAILSEIKTAIKDNKTWDLYQEYEDDNYHTECVLLYAHTVGSVKDKEEMIEVWKERQLSDSLEDSIAVRRDDISKKLWFKFVSNATEKEGVKIMAEGGGIENSFGTREDFDALYEMFPDNHEGTVAKWNSLSQEQKDAFINDLYVTDAASEHIAESWLEFVNALSEEDWLENCTNWDEYSEEEDDSEDEAYKRGATVKGKKHVSVTKGYRMPHGYEAVKGSDKKHTYSKGHPKVRVDEGYRMPKGYEVVEGAYNEKYAKGGGVDGYYFKSNKYGEKLFLDKEYQGIDITKSTTDDYGYVATAEPSSKFYEEFEPTTTETLEQAKKHVLKQVTVQYAKDSTIEEEVYISFLNKEKGFKEDKKYFKGKDAYQKAVDWGRDNFERFNSDMISYTKFAKGSTIRANKSELLKYANFEDNWHINLLKLNPYKNQDGLKYKGENKYAVARVGAESGQEVFEFKTLEQAEVKFGELVTKSKTYSPLISEGKTNNYAKGSTIEGDSCLKEEVYPTDSIVSNWDEKECKSFLFAHWGMRGVDGKGITALEANRNIDNLRLEVLSQIEYAKKHNVPCDYAEGGGTDLISHKVTINKSDYSQVDGTVVNVREQEVNLNLGNDITGVEKNVWVTIIDDKGKEHLGTLSNKFHNKYAEGATISRSSYMGEQGDEVVIEARGTGDFETFTLTNARTFSQIDMFFSSKEESEKYANKKGLVIVDKFYNKYAEGATIQGEGKNIYKAFYKGKEIDLRAESAYDAQKKAAVIFKAKKSYDVTVVVLSVGGKDITHSTSSFAKGGGIDEELKKHVIKVEKIKDSPNSSKLIIYFDDDSIGFIQPAGNTRRIVSTNSEDSWSKAGELVRLYENHTHYTTLWNIFEPMAIEEEMKYAKGGGVGKVTEEIKQVFLEHKYEFKNYTLSDFEKDFANARKNVFQKDDTDWQVYGYTMLIAKEREAKKLEKGDFVSVIVHGSNETGQVIMKKGDTYTVKLDIYGDVDFHNSEVEFSSKEKVRRFEKELKYAKGGGVDKKQFASYTILDANVYGRRDSGELKPTKFYICTSGNSFVLWRDAHNTIDSRVVFSNEEDLKKAIDKVRYSSPTNINYGLKPDQKFHKEFVFSEKFEYAEGGGIDSIKEGVYNYDEVKCKQKNDYSEGDLVVIRNEDLGKDIVTRISKIDDSSNDKIYSTIDGGDYVYTQILGEVSTYDENIAKSVYNDYYKTWQVYIDGSLYGEFKTEEESKEYICNGGYKQESCGCGCEVKSSESDWTSVLDEEEKALAGSVFNKVLKVSPYIEPSNLKNGNKQSLIKALSGSLEMFSDTGKKVATSMLGKLK